MRKEEFINRLINGFPTAFRERNRDEVFDEYDRGLSDNVDFDKLFTCFAQNWDKSTAPKAAWFSQFYSDCAFRTGIDLFNMSEERRSALVKVANWFNSENYQWECRKLPDHLKMLVKQFGLESREIDLMMISGELG